jgi:hypothetical protein
MKVQIQTTYTKRFILRAELNGLIAVIKKNIEDEECIS